MTNNTVESLLKTQVDLLTTVIRELRRINNKTVAETNPCDEISLGPSKPSPLGSKDKTTWVVAQIGTKKLSGVTLHPLDEFYGTEADAKLRLQKHQVAYPTLTIKLLTIQDYFDLKNQNLEVSRNSPDAKRVEEELTNMLTQLFETILGPPPKPPAPPKPKGPNLRDAKEGDFPKYPWSNN